MPNILIEKAPSPMKLEIMGVDDWQTERWEPGVHFEFCSIVQTNHIACGCGSISVADEGEYDFDEGDLITVMPETECQWNITEAIERFYKNG